MFLNFFNVVIGVFLILSVAQATEDDDFPSLSQSIATTRDAPHIQSPLLIPSEDEACQVLTDELIESVFELLDVNTLGRVAQVCKHWKRVCEDPFLWRSMGSRYYGDYLFEGDLIQNPKQTVIWHYLSVIVNASDNLKEIERLVIKYKLYLYKPPFKKFINPTDFLNIFQLCYLPDFEDVLIAQGNNRIFERILHTLHSLKYKDERAYVITDERARYLNDLLVERGDEDAIKRKITGLSRSIFVRNDNQYSRVPVTFCGYEPEASALKKFIEFLVEKENQIALERKIEGLLKGEYGYEKNLLELRQFIDLLVERGFLIAIKRKIKGLLDSEYGYEQDLLSASYYNDLLVEKGDQEAIERKLKGLIDGKYGYEIDIEAAREFCDLLIEKGNSWAIEIKSGSLCSGEWGDKKGPSEARDFIESLIEKNVLQAIVIKIVSLAEGKNGYHKAPLEARAFNDSLVAKGDLSAIERKIEGLAAEKYGYEKNLEELKKFNDLLVEKGNLPAIKRKLEGLAGGGREVCERYMGYNTYKYISYGCYEPDSAATRKFIEELKASQVPIMRAVGHYFTAFGLKYGTLGFETDRLKTIEFIKANHIPY